MVSGLGAGFDDVSVEGDGGDDSGDEARAADDVSPFQGKQIVRQRHAPFLSCPVMTWNISSDPPASSFAGQLPIL